MKYNKIVPGVFLRRPNRFVAHVMVAGEETVCHVKNTGRCRELLLPGSTVYLEENPGPGRKTAYDLVAVKKGAMLINMDAQAPNRVFAEWAQAGRFLPGLTLLRPETQFGTSRFDFYWETTGQAGFVEVKGCTLEQDGVVRFPDAPTLRGVKHVEELIAARQAGLQAAVFFIVQMEAADYFTPNDDTHPAFGDALRRAGAAGVEISALTCVVSPGEITAKALLPVRL